MSDKELLEMTEKMSSAVTDTQAIRDKIFEEFDATTTSDQRVALLGMFKATMDVAESWHSEHATAEELAAFREARAQDYDRLLIKESTVDGTLGGTLSFEMLKAVTDREIAGGRMAEDYSLRKLAVDGCAAPHLTHGELLAQAEAKNKADIAIERLLDEMKSAKSFSGNSAMDMRERIVKEFDEAVTSDQRSTLLAMYTVLMDQVERNLASQGDKAKELADFRGARAYEYKALIYKECFVGLDTPVVGADVSVEMLKYVTDREIAAGRMNEDHSARQLAMTASAAPHESHAELLAKHAKLKEQAEQSRTAPAPKTAPSRAAIAYGVGATLGKKLKDLFRK
jgi:hypothetical protein